MTCVLSLELANLSSIKGTVSQKFLITQQFLHFSEPFFFVTLDENNIFEFFIQTNKNRACATDKVPIGMGFSLVARQKAHTAVRSFDSLISYKSCVLYTYSVHCTIHKV